eukprot:TRINITY_DN44551_c0_g1_i1.p1 TRINITY_DN44551_c0_g1~~TRINITY_DN44551_c0_g1_i1.p1  ORF type:complete len:144 (+),score=18.28 TRINITY_DN44551_c0_g1_i1:176-607(+)
MLRSTKPSLFFEKTLPWMKHPYFRSGAWQLGWQGVVPAPPFFVTGSVTAAFITLLYIAYDKTLSVNAYAQHHHNKFNYGYFGTVQHHPGKGVNFGYNMPFFGNYSMGEAYPVTGKPDPKLFSPFSEDHMEGHRRPQPGDHHHH